MTACYVLRRVHESAAAYRYLVSRSFRLPSRALPVTLPSNLALNPYGDAYPGPWRMLVLPMRVATPLVHRAVVSTDRAYHADPSSD